MNAPELNVNAIISTVLAGQFAMFGWRINREIPVGDAGRRTWFPAPDIVNILSMLATLGFCIVAPLIAGQFTKGALTMLAVASILLAFHPICMIGHYRLFTERGRHSYVELGVDYPYCTTTELAALVLGIVLASTAGLAVWFSH